MIKLLKYNLGRLNVKNKEIRNRYIKKSGIIGLFLNLLLFTTKLIIGLVINSVAVVSDAFNNLADSMSSIVTLIGSFYRQSLQIRSILMDMEDRNTFLL